MLKTDNDIIKRISAKYDFLISFFMAALMNFAALAFAGALPGQRWRFGGDIVTGKLNGGSGAAVLTAAKCARILSLAAAVAMLAFTMTPETMGLPRTAGTVCGCIEIVCAAVCTIGAVTGGILLFRKNAARLNAVSAVFCNAAVTAAIAVFELYRFWYC